MDILKSNLKFICFNTLLPIRHSHIHLCLQNVKANIRGMLQLFKKKKTSFTYLIISIPK